MPERDDDFDDRPRRRRFEDDDYDRPRRQKGGGGGGVVLLIIGVVVLIGLCVVGGLGLLIWPAIARVRDAAARMQSMNNLKQLALGMHNYQSTFGYMPPPAATAPDDRNGVSWRVSLLPYIEQDPLYKQFRTKEPWDSPANLPPGNTVVRTFMTEGDPETRPGTGKTRFRVFVGGGAMFEWDKKTRLVGREDERTAVVADGASNTIMIAEAAVPVTWPKPEELEYDPRGPLPGLGPPFRDVFLVALADGSVRAGKKTMSEATLRALITRNCGEVVNPDW